MALVDYLHEDGVARITLNNPPENRLRYDLWTSLEEVVEDLGGRRDTRAIYLKAVGPDYSLGGDFTTWTSLTEEEVVAARVRGLRILNTLEDFPVPIVTAVQGQCRGGGMEVALRADIIIAAENAKFGHPEAGIGIFTILGGVQRVAERVGRTRAIQWAMTTEVIEAEAALRVGLVNNVVPLSELSAAAEAMVDKLARGPTLAHAAHKKLLRAWSDGGVHAADALIPLMAGRSFMTDDARGSLRVAIDAYERGVPRPAYDFKGR